MALKRKRDSVSSETLKGVTKTRGEVDDPKVHPCGTTLGDLPYDIVNNILLKLPIKSVLTCKCVCKSWHSIISDPRLAQLYFECASMTALVRTSDSRRVSRTLHLLDFDEFESNEAQNWSSGNDYDHVGSWKDSPTPNCHNHMKLEVKFKLPLRDAKMVLDTMLEARKRGKKRTDIACKPEDDKFVVVNSCNGLLCLWNSIKRSLRVHYDHCIREALVVCNPITGEFIRLPQSERLRRCDYVFAGLGYLKKTNEYKVMQIMPNGVLGESGVAEIHTLGTRSWRRIKYHCACWFQFKYPTCLNGSLHWLVYNHMEVSIICFDLESETVNPFPSPSAISSITLNTKTHISFGELKGSLYLCCPYENAKRLRFWTMKKYGDGQSWTEVLSFNMEDFRYGQHLYQPRVVFGGPGILIYDPSRLFIYHDPQKHLCRFLEVRGTSFELEPIFHIPNLMRLKDIVKDDNIEVLNVHSRCATFKLREEKEVFYLARYKADMRI
ncbi:hypothetical protein K1719_044361 [Acacia pycnantha]|nr:hypothetical protein K1719_044361 [Acacia pycnantha]